MSDGTQVAPLCRDGDGVNRNARTAGVACACVCRESGTDATVSVMLLASEVRVLQSDREWRATSERGVGEVSALVELSDGWVKERRLLFEVTRVYPSESLTSTGGPAVSIADVPVV